jgi:hypothetical protein
VSGEFSNEEQKYSKKHNCLSFLAKSQILRIQQIKIKAFMPGIVTYDYNLSTPQDGEFLATPDYVARPYVKKQTKKLKPIFILIAMFNF